MYFLCFPLYFVFSVQWSSSNYSVNLSVVSYRKNAALICLFSKMGQTPHPPSIFQTFGAKSHVTQDSPDQGTADGTLGPQTRPGPKGPRAGRAPRRALLCTFGPYGMGLD